MTNDEAIKKIEQAKLDFLEEYVDYSGLAEAYDLAISALERDRWISVEEALPDNDQDVLVMVHWNDYPEDMMVYGRRYKTRWYLWNGELGEIIKGFDITHWRPLPEPPKEET